MIKIKQTQRQFDFSNIPKVHDIVNRVAEIVVKDIKEGISRLSQDIHGDPFKKISKKTAKKKGHDAPLIDRMKMNQVYVKVEATRSSYRAEISMNQRDTKTKKHKTYGHIHNQGIKPQVKREWFGIGKRVISPVNKAVSEWFDTLYKYRG